MTKIPRVGGHVVLLRLLQDSIFGAARFPGVYWSSDRPPAMRRPFRSPVERLAAGKTVLVSR
jgi:hypothetical protein